ncbi:MAG: hypothetical protein HY329_24455 [Chloroflexi bacterium]|nr:hypothetical protein [Chloroflexota bacterium]
MEKVTPTVVIVESDRLLASSLQTVFELAGYPAITVPTSHRPSTPPDTATLLTEHEPAVAVFHLPLPQDRRWGSVLRLCAGTEPTCRCVIITHDEEAAAERLDRAKGVEIIGTRDYDNDQLVRAVARLLQ